MSNANEPAFPAKLNRIDELGIAEAHMPGLTKREYFAAMIYQQFLAGAVLPPGFDAAEQLVFVAVRAIEAADALLAKLERTS